MEVSGTASRLENLESTQTIDSTQVSINELRRSNRLQQWLEKQARGGYRYIETILSRFSSLEEVPLTSILPVLVVLSVPATVLGKPHLMTSLVPLY